MHPTENRELPRLTIEIVVRLCGLFLLARALILVVAAVSRLVVTPGPWSSFSNSHSWLGRFLVSDSGWYLRIAHDGYNYDPTAASTIGFYPLYPMLIRTVAALGINPTYAGYLISHFALAGACVLLWKLSVWETGSVRIAERSVTFLLFCPGAVWFGMIYTESMFLLTLLGCIYAARTRRWLAAATWGLAASLIRTPGVLLAGFLFLEAAQQWFQMHQSSKPGAEQTIGTFSKKAVIWRPALAIASPLIGQLSFMVFQQIAFGDWRAQQKTAAAGWHTGFQMPWIVLWNQWHKGEPFHTLMAGSLLLVVVVVGAASFLTLQRVGYGAFIFALTLLYISSAPISAMPRYLCTTAPIYLVLAQIADYSPLFETAVLVFSTMLLTLLTVLIVNGYGII